MPALTKQDVDGAARLKPTERAPVLSSLAASAEADERAALVKLEGARRALAAAEEHYNDNPTDDAGRAVLAAREGFSLAELLTNRAKQLQEDVRAALHVAEAAAGLAAAEERAAEAAAGLAAAEERAADRTSILGLAMLATSLGDERAAAVAAVGTAHQALRRAGAELAEAEETFAATDEAFADTLPGRRASRIAADIEHRASVPIYRTAISPDVEILCLLFPAIVGACARLEAQFAAHRAAAADLGVAALDEAHRGSHVLRALFESLPDGRKPHQVEHFERVIAQCFGIGGQPNRLSAVGAVTHALQVYGQDVRYPKDRAFDPQLDVTLTVATASEAHRACGAWSSPRHAKTDASDAPRESGPPPN